VEPFPAVTLLTVLVRERPRTAVGLGDSVYDLAAAVKRAGGTRATGVRPARLESMLEAGLPPPGRLRALLDGLRASGALEEARLADPVLTLPFRPGKVIAVGRNYAKHARELGNEPPAEPFFFGKAPSCCVGPGEPVVLPYGVPGEVHHEAEIAVVIGRRGKHIPETMAIDWVAGYACANDVTARTLQRSLQEARLPWFAAKNGDTFLPLGPGLVPREEVPDPAALRVRCLVDGKPRQDAPASQMLHGVAALVARASRRMTLEPGDVLLTGTPEGVGPIEAGQTVEVRIDGLGVLRNPVVAEAPPA